jgi:molybdopterin molybdotransferase
VQFELIAKPVIYKLLGANYNPVRMKLPLAADYQQKVANRLIIVPVIINDEGMVEEIPFHGSAHINALANANALMEIEPGVTTISKGELVYVRQF